MSVSLSLFPRRTLRASSLVFSNRLTVRHSVHSESDPIERTLLVEKFLEVS